MPETPADPPPAREALRGRLRANLRLAATAGAVLTYHEAARGIGLTPPHVIHSVTQLLEELMEEDAAAGHPFIAALVVSRARDGLPAPGFFQTAARLDRFAEDAWSAEAVAYHAAERALAAAFHTLPSQERPM